MSIYYMHSLGRARRKLVEDLQEKIDLERKDKQFLITLTKHVMLEQ